jgi:hypothetical protein
MPTITTTPAANAGRTQLRPCLTGVVPGSSNSGASASSRRESGGSEPFPDQHPDAAKLMTLIHERFAVDLPAIVPTGGENREPQERAVAIAGGRGPVAIARVLTRPRQRRAEKWNERRRHQQPAAVQMARADVPQLVADNHVPRAAVVAARLEQIRQEHHHVRSQEARGERVQRAILLHEVYLRRPPQLHPPRELFDRGIQVGELIRAHPHGTAADVGDGGDVDQRYERQNHPDVHHRLVRLDEEKPQAGGNEGVQRE